MPKHFEDRVAEEVNRRLSVAAASAGVDRGRIELEVLFLLPPQFVRRYRELFDRALSDPIRPSSDGGKDEGRLKASGRPADPMKARSMGAAAHGKKFVAGVWPIRDEVALEVKRRLDKQLIRLIEEAIGTIGAANNGKSANINKCPSCGLFQKVDWVRCPFHL